jgi:hypothetical protein
MDCVFIGSAAVQSCRLLLSMFRRSVSHSSSEFRFEAVRFSETLVTICAIPSLAAPLATVASLQTNCTYFIKLVHMYSHNSIRTSFVSLQHLKRKW